MIVDAVKTFALFIIMIFTILNYYKDERRIIIYNILYNNVKNEPVNNEQKTSIDVRDTVKINYNKSLFRNEEDIILFCKYIKTQSNDVLTTKGLTDQIFVIQVMFNRMKDNKCNWREYYNNPKINSSRTISLMRSHKLIVKFKPESNRVDKEILNNVNKVIYNEVDSSLIIPGNLMYFHSYNKRYINGSCWKKDKYYTTVLHHFFLK